MDFWNFKAKFYSQGRSFFLFRWILDRETRKLKNLLANENLRPPRVLDIGVGTGLSLDVFPENMTVVGLDRSLDMMKRIPSDRVLIRVVGDAHELPFEDESISFISAIGLTEYLTDKHTFLDEVKRILSKRGYFLVTIARPNILNILRNFLGNRIYTVDFAIWERLTKNKGFICLGHAKTLLQEQFLYQIK